MQQFQFEGIGTLWKIIYQPNLRFLQATFEEVIRNLVDQFDTHYSRFKKDSLIWQIAESPKKAHIISNEFVDILAFGQKLKEITQGRFEVSVGHILENLGYDANYSFIEKAEKVPIYTDWSVEGNTLFTPHPVLLDIGGWGKGYLIDLIVQLFKRQDIDHFLIDGGGDIYASTKPDGSSWKIALEHPLNSDEAFGFVELKNGSLASSGTTLRSFGKYNHLVDMTTQTSITDLIGMHVLADTATNADGAATALFVVNKEDRDMVAAKLEVSYLSISSDLSYYSSPDFFVELFSEQ